MDAASDLHPPISACSFDVLVQLSRQLRPIRCPIVPSSVRVSQNFLTQMDAALGVLLCSSSSGISVPRSCTLRSQFVPASAVCAKISCPSGCRFSNRLLPGCSDIPQQRSLTFRSPVLPASVCASQKFPNGCRSGIATFTFQCGVSVSLPFPSDPVGPPSVRPFAHSICFLLRLRAEAARHSKPVPDSVSANAPGNQPWPWAQSPCLVRALSHMDLTFPWEAPAFAPIFAQRAIELQAVPSIQSLQPPSHEGSAAELLDEAFPRTTAKRKLDLLEGLPSFQLIRKPAVASLRQSTLRHALVSRLLILLKAAGDSCPILALADEDPWMGWQLVSDVVSGRSESTLKARLGYLERYFAWCSDHRLSWVPLTVSATWKWMQALKGASPSAPLQAISP